MSDSSPLGSQQLPRFPQLDDTCLPCMWTIQKDSAPIKHDHLGNECCKKDGLSFSENNGESLHIRQHAGSRERTSLLTHMYRGHIWQDGIYMGPRQLLTARNQEMDHRSPETWQTLVITKDATAY